jgi:hypothetical protein
MNATATDLRRRPGAALRLGALLLLSSAVVLSGCSEQPLPQQVGVRSDDCLRDVTLDRLQEQIKICDEVVSTFPEDPAPRNERYLLHSLAGNDEAACADLREALRLAERLPADQLDEQLRTELEVRRELCAERPPTTPEAPPAPSP